jgi:ribonuclease J
LRKIVDGYDKYVTLKERDTILFAEPIYDYNEKKLVDLQNELALMNIESYSIPKDRSILHHASTEDLMMMIDLLKPKYCMPVEGEYRYMVGNANLASSLGIPAENIILKQNGEFVTFENGELQDKTEIIKINETLIDGSIGEDVGELVIKDREVLGESGIVLVSASLSKKTKEILVGPEVTTRGFIYVKDSSEMISEIKKISEGIITKNTTEDFVDYNNIKQEIRESLSKYFFSETESKPMIIAVIQEI